MLRNNDGILAENGVTFRISDLKLYDKNGAELGQIYYSPAFRDSRSDILKNKNDASKISKVTWNVNYTGVKNLSGTTVGNIGGGGSADSAGTDYYTECDSFNDDGTSIWKKKGSVIIFMA